MIIAVLTKNLAKEYNTKPLYARLVAAARNSIKSLSGICNSPHTSSITLIWFYPAPVSVYLLIAGDVLSSDTKR